MSSNPLSSSGESPANLIFSHSASPCHCRRARAQRRSPFVLSPQSNRWRPSTYKSPGCATGCAGGSGACTLTGRLCSAIFCRGSRLPPIAVRDFVADWVHWKAKLVCGLGGRNAGLGGGVACWQRLKWAKEAEFEAGEEQRGAILAAVPRSEAQSTIRGQVHAAPSDTQGRSRVPELGSLGSVRGVLSNEHSYRECVRLSGKEQGGVILKIIWRRLDERSDRSGVVSSVCRNSP
jgi:hypothetical protein